MRKRIALCVGINDYPGSNNDLYGCVNDAQNWQKLLTDEGYSVRVLLNEEATKLKVLGALKMAMEELRFSDRFVFTYSGHGSWVPDTSGDEADARDECIVLHDWEASGFITDDELYDIYQQRRRGVRITAISDSCFSGTVARLLDHNLKVIRKPRFFEPQLLTPGVTVEPTKRNLTSRPGTVLLSGCSDQEVSYDAFIDSKPQGAFTAAAVQSYSHGMTMKAWHYRTLATLDFNKYPQTPQLQASSWQKMWML